MKLIRSLAVALAALAAATNAQAAGFFVSTHSARATAMSTAVVAGIDDASSVFYNPAGLTLVDNLELQLGDTLIIPAFNATPAGGSKTQVRNIPVFPPHFYAAWTPLKDMGMVDRVSLGVGFFSPFGLVIHWPSGWAGSQLSTDSTLRNYYINPEVAVGFWKNRIRVGGGVQIAAADLDLRRQRQLAPGLVGDVRLSSDTNWGVGGNAGVQIDLVPKMLTVGAHWRSMVKIDFTGKSELSGAGIPPTVLAAANRDIKATIKLPDVVILGIAVHPMEKLWIEANGEYFAWQRLRRIDVVPASGVGPTTTITKNWNYSWTWGLGAELAATDKLRLRAGAKYDNTPAPPETLTPDIPDADRVSVSAGAGYRFGMVSADFGYNLVIFSRQEGTFAGDAAQGLPPFPAAYTGTAHEFGLTLTARL